MEDPNKNTNTNDGYSFYNTKDDHGFNDNIYATQASKTARTLRIIVIAVVGLMTFVAVILMFSGMLTDNKKETNTINTTNTTRNTINSLVNAQDTIFDQIKDLTRSNNKTSQSNDTTDQ